MNQAKNRNLAVLIDKSTLNQGRFLLNSSQKDLTQEFGIENNYHENLWHTLQFIY